MARLNRNESGRLVLIKGMVAVAWTDKAVKAFEKMEEAHSPSQNAIFQTTFD